MWVPIINEQEERGAICDILDNIYISLSKMINGIEGINLYSGKSGFCLFMAYYQAMNKQCLHNIEGIVEALVECAATYNAAGNKGVTYYSQIAWLLCHLHDRKIIDIDVNDYFSAIDEALYEVMTLLLKRGKYDCIDGAISIGIYFYYRYILGSEKCKQYLALFVDVLKKTAIEEGNTMKWISSIDYVTHEQGFDLGIAHGIPGILLFLRELYMENIQKDIIADIITKATNFLLLQKRTLKTHKALFPSAVSARPGASGDDSRLGWCYGDMSVGYALFMISSLDGVVRQSVKESAMDILVSTADRTNLLDIGIVDASLCHGTAGLAHMYNRLYHMTDELTFRNAALYWYKETTKMAKYDDGYAGYRHPDYCLEETERRRFNLYNLSFLTGISGIGLSLLSAIYPIEPYWDRCLLLS